jgi:hypothetical protein
MIFSRKKSVRKLTTILYKKDTVIDILFVLLPHILNLHKLANHNFTLPFIR